MVHTMFNTSTSRGLLYGLTSLGSMVVFGNVAEICDYNEICPGRLGAVIALGVISAIIAGVMFVATLVHAEGILKAELIAAVLLLILNSICVGLTSSLRTRIGNSIAVSFSWFAEILSFILVFACLTADGGILSGLASKFNKPREADEELGEQTPEIEYMRPVGNPTTQSDVAMSDASGTVPPRSTGTPA